VENECTSYNFGLFAIFVPKIIRFGGSLTWLYNKNNFACFLLRHGVHTSQTTERRTQPCSIGATVSTVGGRLVKTKRSRLIRTQKP